MTPLPLTDVTCISRVPDQNSVSRLYNMLEIYHSGPEPSIWSLEWEQQAWFLCLSCLVRLTSPCCYSWCLTLITNYSWTEAWFIIAYIFFIMPRSFGQIIVLKKHKWVCIQLFFNFLLIGPVLAYICFCTLLVCMHTQKREDIGYDHVLLLIFHNHSVRAELLLTKLLLE